jgi:hypothetical protein
MEESDGRGGLERWLDRHNHKMELLRTLTSAVAGVTGILIFIKVFDFI